MNKNLKFLTSSFIITLTLATPQLIHATGPEFNGIPDEVKRIIIKEAAIEQISNPKSPFNLVLVCHEWYGIINNIDKPMHKECVKELYNIRADEEEIFETFYNGALIYREMLESNERMITLLISKLKNPLEGEFDLSQCGDAGQYLSISTGYRKEKKPENENKLEIWLTPRVVIEKKLNSTARHFQQIMPGWSNAIAPVGIFFTCGGWKNLDWYDHLTSQNLEFISNNNLLDHLHAQPLRDCAPSDSSLLHSLFLKKSVPAATRHFMFIFKDPI